MVHSANIAGHRERYAANQKGSALVVCLLVLMVLTTLGVWSMQTSVVETKIATNEQRWEEDFHISEGGAGIEAGNIGYARPGVNDHYEISDPDVLDQRLVPPDAASYDPGNDITVGGAFPGDFLALPVDEQGFRSTHWPHQNLLQDLADNQHDYAYLVTYLGTSAKGIKGYDANQFAAYQFRINTDAQVEIEMGGIKIGVKPN